MTHKDWIAAVFVLLTFVFFGFAFFMAPTMTGGQLLILRFLASASAGFAGLLFAGRATVKGEGALPVIGKVTLVGTASFALFFIVWFSFGEVATDLDGFDQSFSITARVFDEQGTPVSSGDITLHIGQDTREAPIASNGDANFKEIPSAFRGDSSRVVADVPGHILVGPRRVVLDPDHVSELTLAKLEDPLPPVYTTVGVSLWNNAFKRTDPRSSEHYLQIDCGSGTVTTDRFFKGTYFLSSTRTDAPRVGTADERGELFDQLHTYLSQAGDGATGSALDDALNRWTSQDSTVVCGGLNRGTMVAIELRQRRLAGPDSVLARANTEITGRRPAQGIILEAIK